MIFFFIIYLTSDVSSTVIPFPINLLRNSVAISRKMIEFLIKKKYRYIEEALRKCFQLKYLSKRNEMQKRRVKIT